jgi:hypothetical protein
MEIRPQPKSAEEIRQEIEQGQEELRQALEDLERKAKWEVSVGRRIAENAPSVLLAGFICGALLGAITHRGRA